MLFGDLNFAFVPKVGSVSQLYVFQTEMKNATHLVSAQKAKHVANELLVKVKPGTDIKTLAKIYGAKITGQMDKYGVYRLQFPDASSTDNALAQLQNDSDVQDVDYNYYFDPPTTAQQASSASAAPLSLSLNPPPSNGKVIVGLIDTSVDAQSLGSDAAQFILPQINVADGTSPDSGPSHGTAMTAQILQTIQSIQTSMGNNSTSLQIQPVNVYGSSETTTSWDVAQGIQAAVNAGATILNMSLGSSGDSSVLDAVVAEAASDGITMFGAAGNTPMDAPYYPAADSGVHAITALGQPGQLASYANTWADPTMMALPGTGGFNYDGQSWVVQGTSTSTAIATGTFGTYLLKGWTPAQIFTGMGNKWPVPTH
jgi:thermitase